MTVWIDGIAASAASYIAMAGDEIVMPENAFLMIHDPAGMVMGTATDMRAMAEALDKIKGSLLQGYAAKSGRPQEEIAPLMAAETWLDAKDALDLGFADRIAEPVRIAARFDVGRFRNAPPELAEAVAHADEDEVSFGGITFRRYRGGAGFGVATDMAVFYPEAVDGLFEIYHAPADAFETVNTLGQPLYARMIPDRDRDEWVRLEIESNPLPICTRPQVLLSARRT